MARAYPEDPSPRALTRGHWVKDGKGISRWQSEEEAIAHLLDHSDPDCARCKRALLLSRR